MISKDLLHESRQFLDFGSQMRFGRLLAIYRRGTQIFASASSLDELNTLLGVQLAQCRVTNDFEWKTLLLLSAAAFQNADPGTRTRATLCARRNMHEPGTRWSRMCLSACLAQGNPAEMPELLPYLDDPEQIGNTAAIMLSQAAYSHGNLTMLRKAVSRMTLYEEAYSFPGHPMVQYYLGLAMQEVLEQQEFEENALRLMLRELDDEMLRAAFLLGLRALRRFCPPGVTGSMDGDEFQQRLSTAV